MKKTLLTFLTGGLAFCAFSTLASAVGETTIIGLQSPTLEGNHQYGGWDKLSNYTLEDTGTNPGWMEWDPIAPQIFSDAPMSVFLKKLSNGTGGGPYAATSAMYFGGWSFDPNTDGGTLAVTSDAVANVQTIAFQIEISQDWDGSFYNGQLPTLTLGFGEGIPTLNLGSGMSKLLKTVYDGPEGTPVGSQDVFINLYTLQWDLSSLNLEGYGPITEFSIEFTAVQHVSLYGLRVDQTDFAYGKEFVIVPEPATYALLLGAGVLGAIAIRRRRRAK